MPFDRERRAGGIDRDVALCAQSVATGRPIAIADIRAEGAFADNPIVLSRPDLQSYAAVPLLTNDGHAIGTLCVFAQERREFGPEELADLGRLAEMAMRELEFRSASRRALFD